ncbi:hypothetical protein [Mycoplasmopsis pullorum]|uniref:Lipoprotein n=1 Tax=Mycoplasmopsis pullorum TaxID=48003 RepID=A0A1L4FSF3_9BACT|nr:hypothetical protein [Mycoplasmopsis pullorum]APJ38524.1 hypothetical protein BLA55_02540 [Mycoplasmopsis pullorum]
MKNWKRKWISLTLISSLTPLTILSASGCGGFNKTVISKFNEYRSKINVEKEIIVSEMSKISDFLNNKSANEYQNIDTYYLKIAQKGLDLIQNYRIFINKLSENSQKYSELLNNETRDEWINKMDYINQDILSILKERKSGWNNSSVNEYSIILNDLNLALTDAESLEIEKNNLIEKILNIKDFRKENDCKCPDTKHSYLKQWYNHFDIGVNYQLIAAYLKTNSDSGDSEYQELLKQYHTHSLANVLREWVYVTVDARVNENSNVNARTEIRDFIARFKNKYLNESDSDTVELFNNLNSSYQQFEQEIVEVSRNNAGEYPYQKFVNYIVDYDTQKKNWTSYPFGKIHNSLKKIYNYLLEF